jgi:hypothetical protein
MIRITCLLALSLSGLMAVEDGAVSVIRLGGRQLLAVQAPDRRLDAQTALLLQQRLWLDFQDTPLDEACEVIARSTGATIVISQELRAAAPGITLKAENMRADTALGWIAELGRVHLTPMHGGLLVSERMPAQKNRLVLYDASALTMAVPDFPGPKMGVNPDAGTTLFDLPVQVEDEQEERLDELIALLEQQLRLGRR